MALSGGWLPREVQHHATALYRATETAEQREQRLRGEERFAERRERERMLAEDGACKALRRREKAAVRQAATAAGRWWFDLATELSEARRQAEQRALATKTRDALEARTFRETAQRQARQRKGAGRRPLGPAETELAAARRADARKAAEAAKARLPTQRGALPSAGAPLARVRAKEVVDPTGGTTTYWDPRAANEKGFVQCTHDADSVALARLTAASDDDFSASSGDDSRDNGDADELADSGDWNDNWDGCDWGVKVPGEHDWRDWHDWCDWHADTATVCDKRGDTSGLDGSDGAGADPDDPYDPDEASAHTTATSAWVEEAALERARDAAYEALERHEEGALADSAYGDSDSYTWGRFA